jgi:multiple antibiotic resistance protein
MITFARIMELFFIVFAALFSVVNPFGSLPVFLSLTADYTKEQITKTAIHIAVYFVMLLLLFFVAGSTILTFFGITLPALTIAGGLIIISSGFALLKGKFTASRGVDKKVKMEAQVKEDIAFTPMAMPMLSGPGSIAMLISMYTTYDSLADRAIIASVILLVGILAFIILNYSKILFKFLGSAGLRAISRIMGFLILAIGIQYIANGVLQMLQSLK